MNLALPLEVIERIEIVKGPAARVFGQNAFTGAINIVTKSAIESIGVMTYQAGSYGQINAELTLGSSNEKPQLLPIILVKQLKDTATILILRMNKFS